MILGLKFKSPNKALHPLSRKSYWVHKMGSKWREEGSESGSFSFYQQYLGLDIKKSSFGVVTRQFNSKCQKSKILNLFLQNKQDYCNSDFEEDFTTVVILMMCFLLIPM